jgi:hypothetical protein
MATNVDSFPITPAMLAYAWVKPAIPFTEGAVVNGNANATDVYLPKTLQERAGAPGSANASNQTDPDYVFAITAEGPAVPTVATLVITPDPWV